MTGFGFRGHRGARVIGALALGTCCAAASGASAATLHLKVRTDDGHGHPTDRSGPIHAGKSFHILVNGSYRTSELTGQAYLLGFLQQGDTSPCKDDPSKERVKASSKFATPTGSSPFDWDFSFKAGSPAPRRACVYLLPKRSATATPLKRATLTFRVQ
jgi:hypothetical protein